MTFLSLPDETLALSLVRSHAYKLLAEGFRTPSPSQVERFKTSYLRQWYVLGQALDGSGPLLEALDVLAQAAEGCEAESLGLAYAALFEPHGGLAVSPYESDHTKATPQHALSQTYELADVSGFYKAFGLEPSSALSERADHIALQLEFMHVLAAQEAHALEEEKDEQYTIVVEAQRSFFRDHLGRWAERFASKVQSAGRSDFYGALGRMLSFWLAFEAEFLSSSELPVASSVPPGFQEHGA